MHLRDNATLTPFHLTRKLQKLQQNNPKITDLQTEFIYFIDRESALNDNKNTQLTDILLDNPISATTPTKTPTLLITPRPDTISP